jgi:hypothetical protein
VKAIIRFSGQRPITRSVTFWIASRFVLEEAREFVFYRYADSAEELRDCIADRWKQTRLDDATCLRTSAPLGNHADARLWLRERVAIRRLKPR